MPSSSAFSKTSLLLQWICLHFNVQLTEIPALTDILSINLYTKFPTIFPFQPKTTTKNSDVAS